MDYLVPHLSMVAFSCGELLFATCASAAFSTSTADPRRNLAWPTAQYSNRNIFNSTSASERVQLILMSIAVPTSLILWKQGRKKTVTMTILRACAAPSSHRTLGLDH